MAATAISGSLARLAHLFPVYVDGAGLSVGDLHFSRGDGEITFCGAIEMAGWVHMRVDVIRDGMASTASGIRSSPSPITPAYNDYLIFEGISVDEGGRQHYLDVNVAYRRLPQCDRVHDQVRLLARRPTPSSVPRRCRAISAVWSTSHPCATLWLPTQIFDFDIRPDANGPVRHIHGGADVLISPDRR